MQSTRAWWKTRAVQLVGHKLSRNWFSKGSEIPLCLFCVHTLSIGSPCCNVSALCYVIPSNNNSNSPEKKKRLKWAESRVDGRNAGCRQAAASCSSSAKPSSRDPAGQSLILLCHCCSQMWWVKCYLILTTLWKITHGKLRMHGHRCLQKRNLQLDLKYLALVECAANEVALPGSVSGVLGV